MAKSEGEGRTRVVKSNKGVNSGRTPFGCVAVTQLVAHTDCLVQQRVRRVYSPNLLRRRNDGVEMVTQRFRAHSESFARGLPIQVRARRRGKH
jgi:hypothetical protein